MIPALVEPSVCLYIGKEEGDFANSTLIYWRDPGDTVVDGKVISTWAGTKLVAKEGSYPTSPTDGTVLVDNKTLGKYDFTPYQHTGQSGKTYYYTLFPYTAHGKYSLNTKNRVGNLVQRPESVLDYLEIEINAPGSTKIRLPVNYAGETKSSCKIYWGDRSVTNVGGDPSHTYRDGTRKYTITITREGVASSSSVSWGWSTKIENKALQTTDTYYSEILAAKRLFKTIYISGTCPINFFAHGSFSDCTNLTDVNSGLLNNVTIKQDYSIDNDAVLCRDGLDFTKFFYNCASLNSLCFDLAEIPVTIPTTMLKVVFEDMFCNCIKLTVMTPATGFDKIKTITLKEETQVDGNTRFGLLSYVRMFQNTGYKAIPSQLVSTRPKKIFRFDATAMFYNAQLVSFLWTILPMYEEYLTVRGVTYAQMFQNCPISQWLSIGTTPAASHYFWYTNTYDFNCTAMFGQCTKMKGSVEALWNMGLNNSGGKLNHSLFFNGCTSLTNYSSIPDDWKIK